MGAGDISRVARLTGSKDEIVVDIRAAGAQRGTRELMMKGLMYSSGDGEEGSVRSRRRSEDDWEMSEREVQMRSGDG